MIGQFYPFTVFAAVSVGASFNAVVVRATSAATELSNDQKWLDQN
jgi:hypothetical protein